jgi:hypothetical protein|tara:strand:+ start:1662 stop:2129 length:468 start_codon:yes stop_codon:yes gene_type:complete
MNVLNEFMDVYLASINIDKKLFKSKSRIRHLSDARMIYCTVLRLAGNFGLKEIADTINRDHATVIHAVKNYKALSGIDKLFVEKYNKAAHLFNLINPSHDYPQHIHSIIDTMCLSNNKLRKLIAIKDARISINEDEILSLKNKINNYKLEFDGNN